jgi:uncharacterized RDD family membrane protein YckC
MEKYGTTEKRIFAYLIDGALLILINPVRNNLLCYIESVSLYQIGCTFFNALPIVYFVIPVYLCGQTLGKKLMKVKVADASGSSSITLAQAVFRNPFLTLAFLLSLPQSANVIFFDEIYPPLKSLAAFNDNFGFVWFVSELVVYWSNSKRRAIHDYIAGTVVVRTDYLENLRIEKTA